MIKTKAGRCNALFKGKHQIIFETGVKGIETLATCENFKEHPIVLYRGLPYETTTKKLKNTFYINYSNLDDTATKLKTPVQQQQSQKKGLSLRGVVEARCDQFKGTREYLESFKVNNITINVPGQSREFLKDLIVIGQFDKKAILAKRSTIEFEEIWMFDQHACAERINLENLMKSECKLSLEEMKMKACRSAIKFGDELEFPQQERIIKQLENCKEPFHCAHGRTTCWLLAKLKK